MGERGRWLVGDLRLAELLSAHVSTERMIEFLGLSRDCGLTRGALIARLLDLREESDHERARFDASFQRELIIGPGELEVLLDCTADERKRWIEAGLIPILETRAIYRDGREILYPLHDRCLISTLTPELIKQWRQTEAPSRINKPGRHPFHLKS